MKFKDVISKALTNDGVSEKVSFEAFLDWDNNGSRFFESSELVEQSIEVLDPPEQFLSAIPPIVGGPTRVAAMAQVVGKIVAVDGHNQLSDIESLEVTFDDGRKIDACIGHKGPIIYKVCDDGTFEQIVLSESSTILAPNPDNEQA